MMLTTWTAVEASTNRCVGRWNINIITAATLSEVTRSLS